MVLNTLILIFITLFIFILSKKKTTDRSKLPPSPTKLPLIGNLHQLGSKSPHRCLLNLSRKYGDVMLLQFGFVPTLVVSSAKMAREIFKNHDLTFSSRPSLYSVKRFTNNENISFAPYGEYWRNARKIAVLELLTAKRVESFEHVRAKEISVMMDEIAKASSDSPVNLSSLAFRLTNSVICRVAFGRRTDPEFEKLMYMVQTVAAAFNIADYFPRLSVINRIVGVDRKIDKYKGELDQFLDQVLWEHWNKMKLESDVKEDIVDVLLNAQNELTISQIKGILVDIFFAATDTTSTTIVWTMAELIKNPQILKTLQQEVREIGSGKELIQEKDLPKLAYLKLVIKESLRLHTPVPLLLPRETLETCTIGGKWVIPKKTRVIFNATALSIDPEYWEKPGIFWPERFVDKKIDFRGQDFGYLPFGAGRRICPGINFGMQLVELAVANLVFRYDWELPAGMTAEEVDMEDELAFIAHKKVPLCLVAKPVTYK